ncbi:MAG: 3'(2'),5'-bisphosphate nucleotidase CysQ [Gammaproteobacteria bacterium]|nr:3'(2'),5'-bisphosphate nucleotidase CysQ [Gammaproteobacteria bacterium]
MNPSDTMPLLERLVAIARTAGDAILEVYAGEFDIDLKDDRSPLTQADLASHRVIRDALAALAPDIPLLSEESAAIPFETRSSWQEYWLVDPLDGTKEFINRNGEFTVNIALVRGHRPVLGVVHVPVRGQSYYGASEVGAWRRDGEAEPLPISTRRPPGERPVVVGSRSHANPKLEQCLAGIGPYELVSMGSSLKFCLVAEGSADLYPRLGPTSEWDTAAAQAVVEAAGGAVVGLEGEPLPYNLKESFLNPWFLVFGDPDAGWPERLDTDLQAPPAPVTRA